MLQTAQIDTRPVFQADGTIALMGAKNAVQLRHHGSVIRVAFGGSKRAAAQTSAQALLVQSLFIRKVVGEEFAIAEETADMMHLRISIFHALVVDAEAFE